LSVHRLAADFSNLERHPAQLASAQGGLIADAVSATRSRERKWVGKKKKPNRGEVRKRDDKTHMIEHGLTKWSIAARHTNSTERNEIRIGKWHIQ